MSSLDISLHNRVILYIFDPIAGAIVRPTPATQQVGFKTAVRPPRSEPALSGRTISLLNCQ